MNNNNFVLQNSNNFWYGVFPELQKLGVKHAISSKISNEENTNMSFNITENSDLVVKNRENLANAIGADINSLVVSSQVHSVNVCCVDKSFAGRGALTKETALTNTDAIITNTPNLPILLFFADCVPIIIYDPIQKVLGVAHAGWRGTVNAIVKNTVYKMQKNYNVNPSDCYAFIGPSIGPCCYEVDTVVASEVYKNFTNHNEIMKQTSSEKWMLDLWAANSTNLLSAGLKHENIYLSKICTSHNNNIFFSHRKELGKAGRFSVIAML